MSRPQRYNKDQSNNNNNHQLQSQQNTAEQCQQSMAPYYPPTPTSVPSTPIPLYATGAAAIIPAPPTYELIPNRIFVGGYPISSTEAELREHFERFFPVKDVKMVKTLDGLSKGYGFITFETEDQAEEIRKLNPKQLEFRNRKLNLGPAIRKMSANAFPPGYAIAAPNQLVPSPGPFGYAAVPASPGAYGGFPFPPPPIFSYPPIPSQDSSRQASDQQQVTPQLSPTGLPQQSPQVFFGNDQPMRTYASAVAGSGKTEPAVEEKRTPSPQPLMSNKNLLNSPYIQGPPHQWKGNEQNSQQQNETYNNGYNYPSYANYQQPGMYGNGMYQGYSYMGPSYHQGSQYSSQMPPPYWQPVQYYQNGSSGYNNWFEGVEQTTSQYPSKYYSKKNGGPTDENLIPRALQAPRPGRKNRKQSEGQSPKSSHQLSSLAASFKSLSISSPTKN